MSDWTVNSGKVFEKGADKKLQVEEHRILFYSAPQGGAQVTLEDPSLYAHENGDFNIPEGDKLKFQGYWGYSKVSGYDMTGEFHYSPPSSFLNTDPTEDSFSATRGGPPVDLSSWQVSSKNAVIENASTIEVWPDFVTFVSAVHGDTVYVPNVHAVADRSFAVVPSENQPYAGSFTIDGQAQMTGTISYNGEPPETVFARRK